MSLSSLAVARWLTIVPVIALLSFFAPDGQAAGKSVTLLVHGMTWISGDSSQVWGVPPEEPSNQNYWSGMVGSLQKDGFVCGGHLTCGKAGQLPSSLEHCGSDPRQADLFVLRFSSAANTDGLAYKTLELSQAIEQVRRFTGCEKVNLVAHSAGGLVARAYVQQALPGVVYRGDVNKVITIATPHFGSDKAEHFGDFLGTRATSIKPSARLIRRLNEELDLPADVKFASIVVRGFAADVRGKTDAYDDFLNVSRIQRLPLDYRVGGDQVVHVRSQNMAFAQSAIRYEKQTGRPVQSFVARVVDPSPRDRSLWEVKVHGAAPSDGEVVRYVNALLSPDCPFWTPLSGEARQRWIDRQCRLTVMSVIEDKALSRHFTGEVHAVVIDDLNLAHLGDNVYRCQYRGTAKSRGRFFRLTNCTFKDSGKMTLKFDDFGRIVSCQ